MHCGYFDSTRKGNHSSFLTPTVVGGQCPLQAEICAQTDAPLRKTSYTSTHKITVLGHVSRGLSAIAELLVLSLSVSVHLFVFSVCLCINGIMQKALKLLQEKPIKFWCRSYSKWQRFWVSIKYNVHYLLSSIFAA